MHKIPTTISKNHAMIVIEGLHIKNMSTSAKGPAGNPGKNVHQEAGLNRSILDQGWGNFRRMLEYKQDWAGGEVVLVPAMYTSQRCSVCGYVDSKNRKSKAVFKCLACGHEKNADTNAAINILAAGHAVFCLWRDRRWPPDEAGTPGGLTVDSGIPFLWVGEDVKPWRPTLGR